MSSTPFLSIVLPTRDRPQLVRQCLTYIKLQDFQNYEVIISDNALISSCCEEVAPFLDDPRFKYIRPAHPLSMSDHWEYAIAFATGDYIAVISEKFIFRQDAFSILNKLAVNKQPDILSWQYDFFELTDNQRMLGSYHPLLKPVVPECYSAADELKRRLDFIEPMFSRYKQEKNCYGKIYSGCVRRHIVETTKNIFGRVFTPFSPDFTSMICFLSQSDLCLDVGQSLMLLVSGEGISNGVKTRTSIGTIINLLEESNSNFEQYCNTMIIPGFGVGHSVSIASDYQTIMNISKHGHLSNLIINKEAVLAWAKLELEYVEDWAGYNKSDFLSTLEVYESQLPIDALATSDLIKDVNEQHKLPSSREIYHSGLKKVDYFIDGISAERLAELHWIEHIALPRRSVSPEAMTVGDAISYLYKYNQAATRMLRVNNM